MAKATLKNITTPSPPATVAQIAAVKFRGTGPYKRMGSRGRLTNAHALVDRLRPMCVVAIELMSMHKAELIKRVDEHHDTFGQALMELNEAGKDAAAMLDVISSAEARLMVALANVEGDNG